MSMSEQSAPHPGWWSVDLPSEKLCDRIETNEVYISQKNVERRHVRAIPRHFKVLRKIGIVLHVESNSTVSTSIFQQFLPSTPGDGKQVVAGRGFTGVSFKVSETMKAADT